MDPWWDRRVCRRRAPWLELKMYPQAKASRVKDFTNNYRAAPDDSNQGGLPLFNCLTFIVMVHHVTIEIDPVSGSKFSYIRT